MRSKLLLMCASILFTLGSLEIGLRTYDVRRAGGLFETHGNILNHPMLALLTARGGAVRVVPFRTFGFDPYRMNGSQRLISSRRPGL